MSMTNQRDPNRRIDRTTNDERGWGVLPILLAIAVILGAGYILYRNMDHEPTTTRTTQTQPSESVPAPSPAPMTPAPTTPKQP
jgi:hypothetical protein